VKRLRDVVNAAKSQPCVDCGRQYHPCAMDFDHVRGVKIQTVSIMLSERRPEQVIREEISKCEVRCAVCHRLRTHKIPEGQREVRSSSVNG